LAIYFQKKRKFFEALFPQIEAACEGLIYVSETDARVRAFDGSGAGTVDGQNILQHLGGEPEELVIELEFESFFDRLTLVKDWHSLQEKERTKKILELKTLLEENLHDLKVFKIGQIRVRIFAVGIDEDGCLTGITTEAVET